MVKSNIPPATTVRIFSERVFGDFDKELSEMLISTDLRQRYERDVKPLAATYSKPRNRSAELLDQMVTEVGRFNNDELKSVGDYVGVRDLVTEALGGFEEAMTSEPLLDRYKRFLKDTINETTAKLMENGLDPDITGQPRAPLSREEARKKAIELVTESKDEMLIKFTTTVHPTNPWTEEAIVFKRTLTHHMEDIANYAKTGVSISSDSFTNIKDMIKGFVEKVKAGLPIVHIKQVDVAQERRVGRENFRIIEGYQTDALNIHNRAVSEIAGEDFFTEQEATNLYFDPNKPPFAKYTWIDADADGRPATCSEDLARAIPDCLTDKTKLDLRQNAEVHENLVSGLIQVLFKDKKSDFSRFCGEFVSNLNTLDKDGRTWRSPEKSIYQQLGKHRSEFLRKVLVSNYSLVPRSIVAHAVPYTQMYWKKFDEFVAHERQNNPAIPQGISYAGLKDYTDPLSPRFDNLQYKFREQIRTTPVKFELNGKEVAWDFIPGPEGYHYIQLTQEGKPDFFDGVKKTFETTNDKGEKITKWKDLDEGEPEVLMDTLRRLEIMRDIIEKYGPEAVAERYEIANFSDAANFYELLLLFKETGIVQIENGEVVKADLDIMPLLETLEDLEKSDEIFDEILNDPLALSYFKARGNKAQIMLGFSDGAKSGGNFASEATILAAKERLAKKFAAKGITVEFKDGRGNTINRGGMPELGLSLTGSPDVTNQHSKHSQTIQSDHHVQLANSPVRGRNQMASIMMGTMAAKVAAVTRTDKEKELMQACAEAADFITRLSSNTYSQLIRQNPDAVTFQKAMPFNAEASSRSSIRAASEKPPFDLIRAVPWTQKFGTAGDPANYVGLKEALEIFKSGEEVVTNEGGEVSVISSKGLLERLNKLAYPDTDTARTQEIISQYENGGKFEKAGITHRTDHAVKQLTPGQKALEVLRTHPSFGTFFRRAEDELDKNFDPFMAAAWGKKTKHEGIIATITDSLTGLSDIIKQSLRRFILPNRANFVESIPQQERMTQQAVSRAALLAGKKANIDNPAQRPAAVAAKNFLMVSAGNDHVADPSVRQKDTQHRFNADGNVYAGASAGAGRS